MKKLFFVLFIFLFFVSFVYAGDTYDQTVSWYKSGKKVVYYGTIDMTADTIGNFYTQAIPILDLNEYNAYVSAKCSDITDETEDVNVLVQYSPDLSNWVLTALNSGAVDDMDALATALLCDTLNVIGGVQCKAFRSYRWVRLQFDGQTANPHTVVSWWVVFSKYPTADDDIDFRPKNKI